jgi:hypothetical protein
LLLILGGYLMQTISTNLFNGTSTQYTNHQFTAMTVFDGKVIGVGASGVVQLCCGKLDTNAAIDAYLKTGSSNLGWIGKKKNRFIYLSIEAEGNIIITPIIDGVNGTAVTITPSVTGTQYMKVPMNSGDMGYYWAYKVENVDGCWFSINEMQVLPVSLSKRI